MIKCAGRYRRLSLSTSGALGLLMAASVSFAAAPSDAFRDKSDSFLQTSGSADKRAGWTSVIVKIDGALDSKRESALARIGADITRRLTIVDSVALNVPNRSLRALTSLPFVLRVSADVPVRKSDEFTVEGSGAAQAFSESGLTGRTVTVAVVDSGVHRSPDLTDVGNSSRVFGNVSFVPSDSTGEDYCGHGTHVAGIIAGNGMASTGPQFTHTFLGIARRSRIVNVRVLDGMGAGSVGNVLAGIQWVIQNRKRFNIRVMNLSFGHPVGESWKTDPLCQAVEVAWKSGIFVVCAAGNTGRQNSGASTGTGNEGYGTAYGSIQSPGNDPYVITVGAMKSTDGERANDRVATYSSRGPSRLDFVMKPDIVAPGNKIISLDVRNSYLDTVHNMTNKIPLSSYVKVGAIGSSARYFRLSGTSMAAPVVAGSASLMLEADPSLTPDTIKARLMVTADKWADPSGKADPFTYGAGYVNVAAALKSHVKTAQWAMSPSVFRGSDGQVHVDPRTVLSKSNVVWGASDVPNLNVVWGASLVPEPNVVWGAAGPLDNVVWGADILDNVVWGADILDNVVWGASAIPDSNVVWGADTWADNVVCGAFSGAVDLSSTAIHGER